MINVNNFSWNSVFRRTHTTSQYSKLLGKILAFIALISIPTLQLSAILWLFSRLSIRDYIPTCGDWIYYWHEAATFCSVGIGGGIYGNEETGSLISKMLGNGASFTHSILFPALQGLFGRIAGWNSASPVYWNILVVTLALTFYGAVIFRRGWSLALVTVFLLVTPAVGATLGAASQEATNIAIGISIASFYLLFFQQSAGNRKRTLAIVTMAFIWLSCLIRPSWVISLLPILLSLSPARTKLSNWIFRIVLFMVLMLTSMGTYLIFSPPYPYEIFHDAPKHGIIPYVYLIHGDPSKLLHLIRTNLVGLFSWANITSSSAMSTSLVLLFGTSFYCLPTFFTNIAAKAKDASRTILLTVGANIFMLFVMIIAYNVFAGAPRLLLPHLILSLLVVLGIQDKRLIQLIFAISIAALPYSLDEIRNTISIDFSYSRDRAISLLTKEGPLLQRTLTVRPGANPWCNTLLLLTYGMSPSQIAVPPGISFQYMRMDPSSQDNPFLYSTGRNSNTPFSSRYILVDDASLEKFILDRNNLVPLLTFSGGTIYENLSSPECMPR